MKKGYLVIVSIFCAAILVSCSALDNGAYQPSSMDEYAAGAPAGDGSSAQDLSGEFSFTGAGSETAANAPSASYYYDGSRPVISFEYPAPNAAGVGISDHIILSFSEEMDVATINANTVKIIRTDNGTIVPCRYVYENRNAVIKPIMKFSFTGTDVAVSGLKQDNQYKIVLDAANIRDISGEALNAFASEWFFKTTDIDYGFYFLSADGEVEKSVPGRANSFYDAAKPTIVYIHGWQPDTSKGDFGRENPFFVNSKYIKNMNTAPVWKNKGYNIALLYWTQFADEKEVKDAQAKVYMADSDRKDMRYAIKDGTYREFSKSKNMTELAYDCYVQTFTGYTGSEIRFAGHSLGNQLATTLAKKISDNVIAGNISVKLMPVRLALLDPFWGKGEEACVGKKWVGEICRGYVKDMLIRHAIIVEQYKSSAMGGAVADENLDMRKMAQFNRIWPDFIGIIDQADQHKYAYAWYTMSMDAPVNGGIGYFIGAAANPVYVKDMSNWNYSAKAVKRSQYRWSTDAGKKTASVSDDVFKRENGVSTW